MKKVEWDGQLPNGPHINYSIEPSADPLWRITAQAHGSMILYQATVKGPITKQEVEAHFRDDLMKELAARRG